MELPEYFDTLMNPIVMKQSLIVLIVSFTASADIFFDPRDTISIHNSFLPREDTNFQDVLPGYGATNPSFGYGAQSSQNTGE